MLNCGSLLRIGKASGSFPPRPGPVTYLRQAVIINHCCLQAGKILPEVIKNIDANGIPGPDAATAVSLACIPNEASTNVNITPLIEVWAKNLVYKGLFRL